MYPYGFSETTDSDDELSRSTGENGNRSIERRLSSNLLFSGASKSRYAASLAAFNDALYGDGERQSLSPESGALLARVRSEQANVRAGDDNGKGIAEQNVEF